MLNLCHHASVLLDEMLLFTLQFTLLHSTLIEVGFMVFQFLGLNLGLDSAPLLHLEGHFCRFDLLLILPYFGILTVQVDDCFDVAFVHLGVVRSSRIIPLLPM